MGTSPHLRLLLLPRLVGRVFGGEGQKGIPPLCGILHHKSPAKGDDTAEIGGVFGADHRVLIHHGKGDLGLPPDGVHLVARLGRMEIEFAVVVHIAQGHGVGIAVVPLHCQHPVGAPVKDFFHPVQRELLADSAHLAKHGVLSFSTMSVF